ncbi:MAG: type II secretion system protein [bacterium]
MTNRGFTLLEVLVTTTILGMLIAILAGGFWIGIRSWEKGEAAVDRQQRLRVVLECIIQDIRSYYPYSITGTNLPSDEKKDKVKAFIGEDERITFVTTSSGFNIGSTISSGMRAVSYYVAEDNETRKKNLYLRESPIVSEDFFNDEKIDEEGKITLLYNNIEEIKFGYIIYIKELDEIIVSPPANEWKPIEVRPLTEEYLLAVTVKIKVLDEKEEKDEYKKKKLDEERYEELSTTVMVGREEISK